MKEEAHLALTGNVNTKNFMNWADTNRHAVAPVPYILPKLLSGATLQAHLFLQLYFFMEMTLPEFITCSLTGSHYTFMLQNYVILELLQRNTLNDIFWMQDGASFHIEKSVRIVL